MFFSKDFVTRTISRVEDSSTTKTLNNISNNNFNTSSKNRRRKIIINRNNNNNLNELNSINRNYYLPLIIVLSDVTINVMQSCQHLERGKWYEQ